jgi:alpha-2-macroglobulin
MKNAQSPIRRLTFVILALMLGALACRFELPFGIQPGTLLATPAPIQVDTGTGQIPATSEGGDPFRMNIELSEGQPVPQPFATLPPAAGEPLTEAEIEQILRRLAALGPASVEQTEFRLPPDPLPPPRPGQTVEQEFPPAETAERPDLDESGPLEVLRFAPEGEIPIAPFVSITFNQAMVPLTTLADLAEKDVPVKIEPSLPGTWRWLGTKTLTFEYDSDLIDRLPKATQYRVTIPAGTKSLSGGELAADVSWTFSTPAPKVIYTSPADTPQPLEPLFFIAFDQRIDPSAVLATIQVYAGNSRADLRLATEEELEQVTQNGILRHERHPEGRWLAFKAAQPLPSDTRISVTIGPGTPSAEGPLVTSEAKSYSFSTYAPLRVESHGCSWWGDGDCPPLSPFYIRFNNPLDLDSFSDDMLTVLPEIPGVNANAYGNTIEIRGETRGRTTYTVTVSGKIKDEFGQELGRDASLTFRVGPAEPVLVGPGKNFVTIDPLAQKPLFSVYAINYNSLDVKIYAVEPSDWPAFNNYLRERTRRDNPPNPPGRQVYNQSMRLSLPADTLGQVDVDLAPYTQNGFGQFVVIVSPPKPLIELEDARWRREYQTIVAWVQVTQIGLDAYFDNQTMVAWATNLQNGAPLDGVSIKPEKGASLITGADGLARFSIPEGSSYLEARKGNDTAILPRSIYWGNEFWQSRPLTDSLRWFVFDDRAMYRPGEEVHLKGWIRRIGAGPQGDVGLSSVTALSYQVYDATGNAIGEGQADVSALGGFDFVIQLPEVVNLGPAQVYFNVPGEGHSHSFQIQEFRRPEFEVIAQNETSGPYFVGGHAVVSVEAKYFAGGALPNADTTWTVTTSPGSYSPPNWPDFTFGEWRPWWRFYDFWEGPGGGGGETEIFTGKTDAGGFHYLRLDFTPEGDPAVDPKPLSVFAEASVMDVNRQAWASSTNLLVHPADVYVGLRTARYFVQKGVPMKVDFIVADLDGKPSAGRPVEIEAARMEWKYANGEWLEQPAETQTCAMQSSGEIQTCEFETPIGGTYRITARVTAEQGRFNQSRITRWVSGGNIRPSRKVEHEEVTLVPDKQTYQPGDVAEILVQSPFGAAEGLLTVTRDGILYTERFSIDESGATILRIPIEDAHIPNLNLQIDLTGSAPRTDDNGNPLPGVPPRPAYAVGTLTLDIPPLARTLSLSVTPLEGRLEPGGGTSLNVLLKDVDGNPVADAEVAVVVVDEAILALTNYQMADPLSVFYTQRGTNLSSLYARASIILVDPLALAQEVNQQAAMERSMDGFALGEPEAPAAPMPTMAAEADFGGADSASAPPIRIRTDFNPLAVFAPIVRTGADGSARVQVNLPDNLTRYRVMAVAVDETGKRFGEGESNITARLPLMVRPSAPRFLNFGDKFELPVVLQNQTDEDMVVSVVARANNLQLAVGGLRVTVPANDRVEVRFPASTVMAGTTTIQVAAVSGAYADAATISLPVYTPATTEAFATYGVIDQGAIAQPVQYPTGVFPQYGGLEISTSSTALHALTDAVLYLSTYPFESSEQLASRILGIAALRDVLTAFEAEGLPAPAELEAAVARDIENLRGMQNYDGGFPYWQRGFESSPFNTIHVAHALVRAREKGYEVPNELLQPALAYLKNIENYYPTWYSPDTRRTLSAYAIFVRDLAGDRDTQKAESLLREAGVENLSLDAIGWLWPLVENETRLLEIRRHVGNRVFETAGAANFTIGYDDQTYLLLASNRRTDAILLNALMNDNPDSDLIPKIVNGLLAHRTKGRWGNTQENVFVLLSLDRYFNTYESQTPDFVARIWLGETYAGSGTFEGRSTDRVQISIPMTYVLDETEGGMQDLIISKEGAGRLYYRLGLRYAPTDLNMPPVDMGFVVQRAYEGVDNPDDVYKDAEGRWHIKAGAKVRVKLTIVADNRRYHVALVDPLPAGLEIINPALAVSGSVPQDPNDTTVRYGWWWWGPWYEHQNLRDHRAEAFASLLWDGVYTYSYIARATTPGTFVVPPAKAEEMYSPEVFGRSAGDVVIVE